MNTITLQDIINTYYQRTSMQNDLQNIIWPENILMYRIIFRNSFSYQMMDRVILYKSIKEIIPSPWYSVCIKRIPFLHKKVRTLSHKLDLRWQATHFLHGKYFILTKFSPCWPALLFRKSITYKRTLIVSCYYYNISTLIACGFQNWKSSIFFYIGFRAAASASIKVFLLYCSPPHGFISSIKISYSYICSSSWNSFYKNKQHNCCFPTHYATRPYFYYKAILLWFQKRFLLKMYLLFLGIITMYWPSEQPWNCRKVISLWRHCETIYQPDLFQVNDQRWCTHQKETTGRADFFHK